MFAIICNSLLANLGDAHLDIQRNIGLKMKLWAYNISIAARNDLAPKLDVSARLSSVSLLVNVVPFPRLKQIIFWQPSCTHLYPRVTCLVTHLYSRMTYLVASEDGNDISRHSSVPCILPEVIPQWQQENKLLSITAYLLRFPRKGSKVGCSVQHSIHYQIDIAYCSAVWAALFQYSALNYRRENGTVTLIARSFSAHLSICITAYQIVHQEEGKIE